MVTEEFGMDWFTELGKLDNYDWCFYVSLCLALVSVIFSFLSEKYWDRRRKKAVLKSVGCIVGLEDNRCKRDINLKDNYYHVEFGGQAQPVDAITLRAVVKNCASNEVLAKVFLSDKGFVISGQVFSIYHFSERHGGNFYYDDEKRTDIDIRIRKNSQSDSKLLDEKDPILKNDQVADSILLQEKDLIYIKDKKSNSIAAFVFLPEKDDSSEKTEKDDGNIEQIFIRKGA